MAVAEEEGRLVRDKLTWQEINLWQRLMGNVKKKLKLVYVEIPPPTEGNQDVRTKEEFENILLKYKVREVLNSRIVIEKERAVKSEKTK